MRSLGIDDILSCRITGIENMTADVCGIPLKEVDKLSKLLLALPEVHEKPILGGRSGLNADGTPLQFCISSKKEGWAGRLIADPAHLYSRAETRFQKSLHSIYELFEKTDAQELRPLFDDMVTFHLPESRESMDEYPDGVFWVGAPLSGPGIAIYMDGRRGGNIVAWNRLKEWLYRLMPGIKGVDEWIEAMGKTGNIMSIGFEGSSMKNVRLKVYWRLREAVLLDELGCDILKHEAFKNFLQELAGDKQLQLSGMVFSLGFHVASEQFFDVKIDLCGCDKCLNLTSDEWISKFKHFTRKYNTAPFPVEREILEENAAVSYFGFGMDVKQNKRLNLYLKSNGQV